MRGFAGRPPGASLLISLFAVTLFWLPSLTEALQFDRGAIVGGEWWRWLTGHLTHWSVEHLVWDVLAFAILASLCERKDLAATVTCVVSGAAAISGVVWQFEPDIFLYRGLSGVNAALFVFLAVTLLREQRAFKNLAALSLIAFTVKMSYEVLFGQSFFVSEASMVELLPLAHIVGSATGAAVAYVTVPPNRPVGLLRSARPKRTVRLLGTNTAPSVDHSCRNATTGCTRLARRAGTAQATTATESSSTTTARNVVTSLAGTPWSM